MLVVVGEPLTAGVETVAPVPLATVIEPIATVGTIAAVAPVTLAAGILEGTVGFAVAAAVGVPVMLIVTTVPLVRVAVPAVKPAGKFDTVKFAAVMLEAYVPLVSVNVTDAPLTACPTLRLPNPLAVASIDGTAAPAVVIAALRCAAPAL